MKRPSTYRNISGLGLCLAVSAMALGILTLSACKSPELGGPLQAESPKSATALPPSHANRPIVAAPSIRASSVPPGTRIGTPVGSLPPAPGSLPAPSQATAPIPSAAGTQASAMPSPDLPSLAHLINRPGAAGAEQVAAVAVPRPVMPPPATTDTVRVALLLPLSGRNAALGKALLNAAQLAVFDFADRRMELLPVDTQGGPAGAQQAVATAIGDGASIILGPLLGASVRAVAPATRAASVPVIGFSSDRSVAGGGVYTMGFLPEDQVRRVVTYAYQKGITRFAALAPDNAYGATVVDTMAETLKSLGAEFATVQYYDPTAQDFSAVVRKLGDYDNRRQALIKQRKELENKTDPVSVQALKRLENLQTIGDLPFDALLIADGGKRLQSVAALLPFYDIDPSKVRMLGTGQWDVPGIGAEPALLGAWYAAPAPAARIEFQRQYKATYDVRPPRLATLAYDAAALVSVLAQVATGPDFSDATLTTPSGFEGRDGIFRFLRTGVAERGLAVLQIRKKDAKVISPAPVTFERAIN